MDSEAWKIDGLLTKNSITGSSPAMVKLGMFIVVDLPFS